MLSISSYSPPNGDLWTSWLSISPPVPPTPPLTVMQALDLDGFVVVTTPQELAKIDAKRSINMIRKLHVNVLGVVENFSGEIFGSGAGEGVGPGDGPQVSGPV